MPADCLACELSEPFLAEENQVGANGNPIGCCINCHSLMCGHHGRRDKEDAKFLCVICVPLLASELAALQVEPETQLLRELRSLIRAHSDVFPERLLQLENPVLYFEQWRPENKWFEQAYMMTPTVKANLEDGLELRQTLEILIKNENARKLLAIAQLAIDYYRLDEHIPTRLKLLLDAIEWRGYDRQ
jgi:hypothetical protein